MRCVEEVKIECAEAEERVDKHGELETRGIVKEAKTCEEMTDSSNPTTGQCKKGKCISIGEDRVCTDCGKAGEVPINGECTTNKGNTGCTDLGSGADGTCASYTGANYFLHKGGCYSTEVDKPGRTLCTAAGDGVYTTGAEGYFAIPEAPNTGESVVACNDATTGVTIGNTKYKGVADCAACNAPAKADSSDQVATCTTCSSDKIIKTETTETSCVDKNACKDGFFVDATAMPNKCTACTDENCNVCAEAGEGKCTQCKTAGNNQYLKKADGSQTGTCVDEAGCTTDNTYYADDTGTKTCKPCAEGVSNCKMCTKKGSGNIVTCSACLEGFFAESKSTCTACADSNCAVCTAAGTGKCSKCRDGYTLDSQANTCASSSANRSGLSSGAIAGISVAAVVVVGGLVGFLCWWFVCRGKA